MKDTTKKSLDECKDEVARKYNYPNWDKFITEGLDEQYYDNVVNEVAELHSKSEPLIGFNDEELSEIATTRYKEFLDQNDFDMNKLVRYEYLQNLKFFQTKLLERSNKFHSEIEAYLNSLSYTEKRDSIIEKLQAKASDIHAGQFVKKDEQPDGYLLNGVFKTVDQFRGMTISAGDNVQSVYFNPVNKYSVSSDVEQAAKAYSDCNPINAFKAGYKLAQSTQQPAITTLQQANTELKEEVKTLKRVNGAYKIIKESQEATISHYSKKANDINNAVATLESEREMNAILTSEKEELEKQNAELVAIAKEYYDHLVQQDKATGLNIYSNTMKARIYKAIQSNENKG